jgi:hypothetical protein
MRTLLIAIAIMALLSNCSEKQPIVYENDTEPHEWGGINTIKERPNAHSGKSVSIIDSITPYSLTFGKRLEEISPDKIKSVLISYWVYFKNPNTKANTVLSINLDGKNNGWQSSPVENKVKELNTWTQITEIFPVPENIDPKNVLALYVWNNSKEEILIDDFHIEFNK